MWSPHCYVCMRRYIIIKDKSNNQKVYTNKNTVKNEIIIAKFVLRSPKDNTTGNHPPPGSSIGLDLTNQQSLHLIGFSFLLDLLIRETDGLTIFCIPNAKKMFKFFVKQVFKKLI